MPDTIMFDAPSDEYVTIRRDEYARLRERSRWLAALEDAGVDNWDGIDYAQELKAEMDDADSED